MPSDEQLQSLRRVKDWSERPDCISDDDINQLANGRAGQPDVLVEHVSQCDRCGERLRIMMHLDEASLTPEQEALLDEIAAEAMPVSKSSKWKWFWQFAPAVAVLLLTVAAVAGWSAYRRSDRRIARLLARAYTDHREFDWRLPDNGWSPRQVQRSGDDNRPASLLEAQSLLAAKESRAAVDLDLRGRAELLESRVDSAVKLLTEAVNLEPTSSAVLSDLAAAYAIRADLQNRSIDYGAVVEYTTRALYSDPRNLQARFNRALAYEHLSMIDQAVTEWRAFLNDEKDSLWAAEAQKRLDDLIALQQRRGAQLNNRDETDQALEELAVNWLADDRAKAQAVGRVLMEKYGDTWLRDAAAEATPDDALVNAVKSNAVGHPDEALNQSRAAINLYRSFPAHLSRARLEETLALNRMAESRKCLDSTDALIHDLSHSSYHWLRIYAQMTQSSCRLVSGDPGGSTLESQTVAEEASRYHLAGLELRARGFVASSRVHGGDPASGWEPSSKVLARLYDSPYPPAYIQQCLSNLSFAAEALDWYAAASVLMSAAADTLEQSGNRLMEATNRSRAASMALIAQLAEQAQVEATKAQQLFAQAPAGVTRTRYLESIRVLEAHVLEERKDPAGALRKLLPVPDQDLPSDIDFQARLVAGTALRELGRIREGKEQLEKAIQIGNLETASLGSPAERALNRRRSLEAYRALAACLIDEGDTAQARTVWMAAYGSSSPPKVIFITLDDGYGVWTEKRFARIHVDRREIRKDVYRLLVNAADPASSLDAIRQDGRRLFETLILPIQDGFAADSEVTVLTDGELAALPFQLLVDRENHWIGERSSIVMTATGTPALGPFSADALIVANPAAPGAPPIADVTEETAAVRDAFVKATVFAGADASLENVGKALPAAGTFHFAGHGFSANGNGGLYLSDTPLTAASIRHLPLQRCRLVVLAACLTGIGENEGFANSDSLVRSFLDAGVGTVIASRWEVDSAATAELMDRFYRSLTSTDSIAKAFLNATTELRSLASFRHPYFWSGFQIYE